MNLLLFLITLAVSFIIVRVGAIAFELTGLEWSIAKFQSLSCFTGTGFTTKESEFITSYPQRRRIASFLIVLGHAGFVTLIATFANTIRPTEYMQKFSIPFLHVIFPSHFLPWMNLSIIAISSYGFFKLFTHSGLSNKINTALRKRITKHKIIQPVSFEELLLSTGGYGVSSIEICEKSPILNKSIIETDLKKHDIMILVIERKGEAIPNPPSNMKIISNDRLICFGKLEHIKKTLCPFSEK